MYNAKFFLPLIVGALLIHPQPLGAEVEGESESLKQGMVGIALKKDDDFPSVAYIVPNSPAAIAGTIRAQDQIIYVGNPGALKGLISTRNLPIQEVAAMLQGTPNSVVNLKLIRKNSDGSTLEIVTALQRSAFVNARLADGTFQHGFLGTNVFSMLPHISRHDSNNLMCLEPRQCLQISNGMSTNDVIRLIGLPLVIQRRVGDDELSWQYGWQIRAGHKILDPGTVELVVTNGSVSEAFQIGQPTGEFFRVEILAIKPNMMRITE